jgi:hypothetical protein
MSTPTVLTVLFALAFLGLLFGLTLYSRWRATALLEENANGDAMGSDRESFSDHYRPMTRILDPREMEACRSLSGLNPGDFARFRAARITAFRTYLNEMRLDFNRIEFKLRYMMLAASQNEAELVARLNQVKASFQLQLIRVEFQLLLFRLGWAAVDVEPLVQMLEQLEACLTLRPSSSAAAA